MNLQALEIIGILGIILLFCGLLLPILIIAGKGFFPENLRKRKTKKRGIVKILIFILSAFYILPSVMLLSYHFIKFVVLEDMPIENFNKVAPFCSYQLVLDFYLNEYEKAREFIFGPIMKNKHEKK